MPTATPAIADLPTVDAHAWAIPAPTSDRLDEMLVDAAALGARTMPLAVDEALLRFASRPNRAGALLLRHLAIGPVPSTPSAPTAPVAKDLTTELVVLTVARRLGQPVGYLPEHGGRLVQNIVPTRADAHRQTSTSSGSNLMFHTETAFHPHRPRYLVLLCLRGDPCARTTLASVHDLIDHLAPSTVEALFEPRYRTAVDASFLGDRANVLGPAHALISGTRAEPTFVFDADLTVGVDPAADAVLAAVREAIDQLTRAVVLEPGDLLVIDNNIAVHGRSPFPARFDGADRWLQRAFVVADLAPSAADRDGRIITTRFGG